MSLDLGSSTLEVVIAISFVFFLLSVIVTTLGEWVAGVLGMRAKTLKKGLEGMLGDREVVGKLLDHTLIRTNLTKDPPSKKTGIAGWFTSLFAPLSGRERGPSYIAPRNFAKAFTDVVEVGTQEVESTEVPALVTKGKDASGNTSSEPVNEKLAQQLKTLAVGAAGQIKIPDDPAVEKWFDDAMDRVSGWYKRKAQVVTIVLAVVVTLALNANAVRVVERLATDPAIRTAIVAKAETASAKPSKEEEEEEEDEGARELKVVGKNLESTFRDLEALKLPLLWAEENVPSGDFDGIATAVAGWLLTIIAISLGAPFWFDALGKLSNLRSAGKKPEQEPKPGR